MVEGSNVLVRKTLSMRGSTESEGLVLVELATTIGDATRLLHFIGYLEAVYASRHRMRHGCADTNRLTGSRSTLQSTNY